MKGIVLRMTILARTAGLAALSVLIAAAQQPGNQGGGRGAQVDPAAVARGQQAFGQNCGFCHGADAKGGAEGGPDLTRSQIVTGAAQFGEFLKVGRPDKKMPAFSLPDGEVADMGMYLRSLAPPAGGRGRGGIVAEVVGDAAAGQSFFNGTGKCTTCHSVTGDLKGIGGRLGVAALQGRIVLPRGTGGYPGAGFGAPAAAVPEKPKTVTVTPASGPAISGTLVSVSDYIVVLRDSNGVRRSFTRSGDVPKVVIKDPLQAHLDLMPNLTDSDMHNLTAYLVTLK